MRASLGAAALYIDSKMIGYVEPRSRLWVSFDVHPLVPFILAGK